jgi:hypothetical protein
MKSLFFDWVDSQLESPERAPTLRRVRNFIRINGLPEDAVVGWLKNMADTVIARLSRRERGARGGSSRLQRYSENF